MSADLSSGMKRLNVPLPWKPSILDLSKETDRAAVDALMKSGDVRFVCDDYEEQLREHFSFLNPSRVFDPGLEQAFQAHRAELEKTAPISQHGRWVHYPWRATLVHVLEDEAYQQVRTSRNRNLITADEQKKFYDAVVGIAGLSVGNSVALATVLQGGARRIRLADFDNLALSNLNRVRASSVEFGSNKAEMTARQIYEINPYAEVELFTDGLTESNIAAFFEGGAKLDVVVDEIDNLAVKCLIRENAKRLRLPVVMAADNGDNGVVDIERYDLDPETPFFQGRMGAVSYDMLKNLDKMGIGRLIVKHIGAATVTPRVRASMLEIGKTIVSWPQLGGAALLNGCAVAYCIRAIVNGLPLEKNRALVDLDEKLTPDHDAPAEKEKRALEAAGFAKMFGL
jgi:molybdopterin/thiamine biosynthesis adenylyltransferase